MTREVFALLFSHDSHLHPTGQKHHTGASQNSYRCPSPRTWPRYILAGDLTPQTKHPGETLYFLPTEEVGRYPHLTCMPERKMGIFPPVQQQVEERTHPRQESGVLDLDSSYRSSATLAKSLTSMTLFPICEMGTKVNSLRETWSGPRGIRYWNCQIIAVFFPSPSPATNNSVIVSTVYEFPGEFRYSVSSIYWVS